MPLMSTLMNPTNNERARLQPLVTQILTLATDLKALNRITTSRATRLLEREITREALDLINHTCDSDTEALGARVHMRRLERVMEANGEKLGRSGGKFQAKGLELVSLVVEWVRKAEGAARRGDRSAMVDFGVVVGRATEAFTGGDGEGDEEGGKEGEEKGEEKGKELKEGGKGKGKKEGNGSKDKHEKNGSKQKEAKKKKPEM